MLIRPRIKWFHPISVCDTSILLNESEVFSVYVECKDNESRIGSSFKADSSILYPFTFAILDTYVTCKYILHALSLFNINAEEIIFVMSSIRVLSM